MGESTCCLNQQPTASKNRSCARRCWSRASFSSSSSRRPSALRAASASRDACKSPRSAMTRKSSTTREEGSTSIKVKKLIEYVMKMAYFKKNIFIESRTIRPDAPRRGLGKESAWVFAMVIDSDADKGKGWDGDVEPSLVVETSPGNRHLWFFLEQALGYEQARALGANMRAAAAAK